MRSRLYAYFWRLSGALVILISMACSLSTQSPSREEVGLSPTRTPLPTFTPTTAIQVTIPIPPTPTDTPVPPSPTTPPSPTPEPIPTDTPPPEPTATHTPMPPPPTEPPPTQPPPPTEPPLPSEPVAGAHGVIGKITFRDGRNTYSAGEKVFVKIEATNTGSGLLSFGVLGLTTSTGTFQTSWSDSSIGSNETFQWEDGLAFSAPGTYKMWLSICFSTKDVCQGPDGDWERFEPGLDVFVQ